MLDVGIELNGKVVVVFDRQDPEVAGMISGHFMATAPGRFRICEVRPIEPEPTGDL